MKAGVRVIASLLALVFASMPLAGCVSDGYSADADGLAVGPRAVQIFVASTRPPKGGSATVPREASYALTTISVPPGHEAGTIERPSFGSPDPADHFLVAARRGLSPDTFRNEVASHISGRIGSNRDVLLFVHGFNTGFDEARFRLAQLVVDGGFNGVPVLFTWPSKESLFAYGSDREIATASRDALEKVIESLAAEPDVGKVHVLAHSMGAWLAMEALRETAIAGHPDLDGHLGEIMLAAPDIDLDVFRGQVARLGGYAHVSVFAADDDRALALSGFLADRPRLGALDPNRAADRATLEKLGVKVVDISRLSTDFIGHATYAAAPQIIRGIGAEIGAARSEDKDTQAVLDGSVEPTGRLASPRATIAVSPLAAPVLQAPAAATPVVAPPGSASPSAAGAPVPAETPQNEAH